MVQQLRIPATTSHKKIGDFNDAELDSVVLDNLLPTSRLHHCQGWTEKLSFTWEQGQKRDINWRLVLLCDHFDKKGSIRDSFPDSVSRSNVGTKCN